MRSPTSFPAELDRKRGPSSKVLSSESRQCHGIRTQDSELRTETMNPDTQLDVLAIGAHPDDVELGCGGILIKLAAKGYRVGVMDMARGEMGTRGSAEIRASEAECAAKEMGLVLRDNL